MFIARIFSSLSVTIATPLRGPRYADGHRTRWPADGSVVCSSVLAKNYHSSQKEKLYFKDPSFFPATVLSAFHQGEE